MRSAIILQTINHQEGILGGKQNMLLCMMSTYISIENTKHNQSINHINSILSLLMPLFRSIQNFGQDLCGFATGCLFVPLDQCSILSVHSDRLFKDRDTSVSRYGYHCCCRGGLDVFLREPAIILDPLSLCLALRDLQFPLVDLDPFSFFSDSKSGSAFESLP